MRRLKFTALFGNKLGRWPLGYLIAGRHISPGNWRRGTGSGHRAATNFPMVQWAWNGPISIAPRAKFKRKHVFPGGHRAIRTLGWWDICIGRLVFAHSMAPHATGRTLVMRKILSLIRFKNCNIWCSRRARKSQLRAAPISREITRSMKFTQSPPRNPNKTNRLPLLRNSHRDPTRRTMIGHRETGRTNDEAMLTRTGSGLIAHHRRIMNGVLTLGGHGEDTGRQSRKLLPLTHRRPLKPLSSRSRRVDRITSTEFAQRRSPPSLVQ